MSIRELIALGTSSQLPTRERSHSAYLLRWDGEGFLLDPGEGAQRQLILARVAASSIHNICITHFHGDHCLGLAGIVQRLSVDCCRHPVHLFYPESGQPYIDRLCNAAVFQARVELVQHPIGQQHGEMFQVKHTDEYSLKAHPLDHSIPCLGFRLEESERLRFLPERLDAMGIHGSMVGELQRNGRIHCGGRVVALEEVAARRPGSVFAFVMDTRPCPGTVALAKDADLLVMEATYTSAHQDLANLYFHSTAADAARTALSADVHRLALTHFSQRYEDAQQHLIEAREIFPKATVLNDLDRIDVPRRPRA